jgi:hypothetical protein
LFLVLLGAAVALRASFGSACTDAEAQAKGGPIKGADFPKVCQRIQAFEARINSANPSDRERVVAEVTAGWRVPDTDTIPLLKRIVKQDPDPWLRGLAVRALHDRWVPLDPGELPATFTGYHRGQLLDRRRQDLEGQLIKEVRSGGLPGGYAAYALGLLRCRKAAPDLRDLAESKNAFVRYSAGRALIECGDKEGAAAILKTIMGQPVPPNAAINQIEDPHYQALAARAYIDLGEAQKKAGIERLLELMKELENWQDINAPGRLDTTRGMLVMISRKYFLSHQEARAWHFQK